jgi:DNA-binding NtrC family response regulator
LDYPARESMPANLNALDVLLVEDEFLIRWAISRTLTSAGHRVREASDAASAIQALKEGPLPEVVLLDYRLPDTQGLSLVRDVRDLAPGTALVMMSADPPADMAGCLECGVSRILHKPFDMDDVGPALRTAVDLWRGRCLPGPAFAT